MRVKTSVAPVLLAYLPLLLVAAWAYAPAEPHSYPSLEALLLEPYAGAGQKAESAAMRVRQLLVLVLSLLSAAALARRARGMAQHLLAGVLASLLLLLPTWVPVTMEGRLLMPALSGFSLYALAAIVLTLAARRLPAIALPLTALCVLLGVGLAVRTAAEVVLRSQPPLFVLADAVRNPQSAEAQLAVGLHLYSIGGVEQALPYLRAAGEALAPRFSAANQPELRRAAEQLAGLAPHADNDSKSRQTTTTEE